MATSDMRCLRKTLTYSELHTENSNNQQGWYYSTVYSDISTIGKYLTSVSHLGWPSRAAYLGGLGLIRTSL